MNTPNVPAPTWPETEAEQAAHVDWQHEVANGDTLRGFREWIAWVLEAEAEFGDDHSAPAWAVQIADSAWVPINDFPGDQRFDNIPGTADESYWGEIGKELPGWSWTIIGTNDRGDQCDVASGRCGTESEAKAAVRAWRPTPNNPQRSTCERCGRPISHGGSQALEAAPQWFGADDDFMCADGEAEHRPSKEQA